MDSTKTQEFKAAVVTPLELPHPRRAHPIEPYDEAAEIREYLEAVRERWRMIAAATILAMLGTVLITKFGMTRWYRAEAIIRPIADNAVQGRVAGLVGGLSGVGLGEGLFSSEASNPASEYMPVLESFDFTTRLVAGHGLESHLPPAGWGLFGDAPADPDWARYREIHRRFNCDFSIRTGNLTLYYQDPDRAMAGRVLGFYISDLRELLRAKEIHDTTEAITSLRDESNHTSDNLLQTQLDEMLARQIQQQKLAQVQADFAFKVLESPTTPDKPYRPKLILNSVMAGMIAIVVAVGFALFAHSLRPSI